jgi:hypothetical protein
MKRAEARGILVRIQRRVSKKQYLKTKHTYEYERLSLDIPKKYHKTIAPLLKQDFDVDARLEKGSIILALTPRENVSACRKHTDKTLLKAAKTMVKER